MWLPMIARVWWLLPMALLTLSTAYYRHDAQSVRAEFAEFKTQLALTAAKAEADKATKEKENAQKINSAVASRDSALRRLRESQATNRPGFVSSGAGTASASGAVCYDANQLDRALRELDKGVSGLVGQGDQAVIDALSLLAAWPK